MKMLLAVTVLTMAAVCGGTGTSGLPHPWLSLDRTAKVLHLQCKPPPEASYWKAVHDIRLSAFLNHYSVSSNISLVNMTSNMEEPKVSNKFTIFHMSFEGTWLSKSVSLDFRFPVTSKELGRYFCMVIASGPDDKHLKFTTEVVVDRDFVYSHTDISPKSKNNFEANVIDAHEVNVTWMKPENSKFEEASVSRILVDAEGNSIAPSMSLLTTNGVRHFVYDSQLVLFTKFNPKDSGNFSITLYVKREQHSSSYRYSCSVPYPACTGHRAVFCTCCQQGSDPDRQKCLPFFEDCQSYFIPFVIFVVLSIIFVPFGIVALTVYCLYKKINRCSKSPRLIKLFAQKRESTTTTLCQETVPLQRDQNTPVSSNDIQLSESTSNPSNAHTGGSRQNGKKRAVVSIPGENDMGRSPARQNNQPRGARHDKAPQISEHSPRKRNTQVDNHTSATTSRQAGVKRDANTSISVENSRSNSQTPSDSEDDERNFNDQTNKVQKLPNATPVSTDDNQTQDESSLGAVGGQSNLVTSYSDIDVRLSEASERETIGLRTHSEPAYPLRLTYQYQLPITDTRTYPARHTHE